MATFGPYESGEQIVGTRVGAVWKATRPQSPRAYVVRTCQPDSALHGEKETAAAIQLFLERARVQKDMAGRRSGDGGASHWAPVHEQGEVPGGVWYATDHYLWSAEQLIKRKVRVDAGGLYRFVDGVTRGLEEIKAALGRPHGNLKPSNILLDGSPGARRTRVFLAEPAHRGGAGWPGDPEAEADDLRALGKTLFELITGQSVHGDWSALASFKGPRWSALGPKAQAWGELCRRLADPESADRLKCVEDLRGQLGLVAPAGLPAYARPVAAGAAALVLLSAGATAWFLHRHGVAVVITDHHDRSGGPETQPATRPDGPARGPGEESADWSAYRKWASGITPPDVRSAALRSAWEAARDRQLAGRTAPDPAVKAMLEELRDDLQSLEKDLTIADAAQVPAEAAAGAREELYRKAALAVAGDASAADPSAVVWAGLRQDYARWLRKQADARGAVEVVRLAREQQSQKRYRPALDRIDEALRLDPGNAPALALRQQVLDAEEAELADARATGARGDLAGALAKLGDLLNRDPDSAGASQLRDEVSSQLGAARSVETLLRTADDQTAQGNDGAALQTLENLLKLDPHDARASAAKEAILAREAAVLSEATTLVGKGDLAGARDRVVELLERHPNFPDGRSLKQEIEEKLIRGLLDKALARAEAGESGWQDALALLDQADKVSAKNPEVERLRRQIDARVEKRLAVSLNLKEAAKLEQAGDWKGAVSRYNKAAALEPENPDVTRRLAAATEQVRVADLLEQARKQLAGRDFAGAESILATVGPGQADADALLQAARAGRLEQEKAEQAAQAAAAAQAGALTRQAGSLLEAGDPASALDVLGRADNERVRALVRKASEEVRARVAAAPEQCRQGIAAYARQDYAAALAAFQRAAQGGNVEAMTRLAGVYLSGAGTSRNPAAAAFWFKRAADLGNSEAMYSLASLYEAGNGVDRNTAQAVNWYSRSAGLGNTAARSRLDALNPPPTTPVARTGVRPKGPRAGDGIHP